MQFSDTVFRALAPAPRARVRRASGVLVETLFGGADKRALLFAPPIAASAALPDTAEDPPARTRARIRGTIENVESPALTAKSRDGTNAAAAMAPNFRTLRPH